MAGASGTVPGAAAEKRMRQVSCRSKGREAMSKELQKEFADVIGAVARDVSENVIKNTALKSVERLNQDLKELQETAACMASDIRKAQGMYDEVAQKSGRALQEFNTRVERWSAQQEALVAEIAAVEGKIDQSFGQVRTSFLSRTDELSGQIKAIEEHMAGQDEALLKMRAEQAAALNDSAARAAEAYARMDEQQQAASRALMGRVNWTLLWAMASAAVSGAAVWLLR